MTCSRHVDALAKHCCVQRHIISSSGNYNLRRRAYPRPLLECWVSQIHIRDCHIIPAIKAFFIVLSHVWLVSVIASIPQPIIIIPTVIDYSDKNAGGRLLPNLFLNLEAILYVSRDSSTRPLSFRSELEKWWTSRRRNTITWANTE
jgi:hypothetical protein